MLKLLSGMIGVLLASSAIALMVCSWRWFRRGLFCSWTEWRWWVTILVVLGCFGLLLPSEKQ